MTVLNSTLLPVCTGLNNQVETRTRSVVAYITASYRTVQPDSIQKLSRSLTAITMVDDQLLYNRRWCCATLRFADSWYRASGRMSAAAAASSCCMHCTMVHIHGCCWSMKLDKPLFQRPEALLVRSVSFVVVLRTFHVEVGNTGRMRHVRYECVNEG